MYKVSSQWLRKTNRNRRHSNIHRNVKLNPPTPFQRATQNSVFHPHVRVLFDIFHNPCYRHHNVIEFFIVTGEPQTPQCG
ncbi:hypothetical protein HanXRQr2_Chr05g0199861 [Helianthus annuus]|uniref:Uncharacterized protein n=1 Tax=Helianthus annuus TaxID=4232 RepID=A0A251UM44_HELAN|nr:hypothetical protein HanXRQr2_Chr05g0199861 [Helianthus annuus]KAJ0569252.1 hypothetical protein HanHA300_Chr05g0163991 [Helianthus annuus]KAJ0583561.1 hypothetical protein HanHA89_Chr05g0178031 [Helianthus annuus]KAJ0749292.1 hypothetical protein HanLR1_Chr05g0168161 [Helianthus annuus]KAJ0921536.1 hypothetical protein HanPSC8_Chr05g0192691 [Helianthus annuus]